MDIKILDLKGKVVGKRDLPSDPWEKRVNLNLLNQIIAMYRNNLRSGNASTKTRGNVSGGGKKPWRQKHTGRARAGSIRSPLWRGGGIVFGPHPRRLTYRLPQSMRRKALLESLKGKIRDDELVVVKGLTADEPKTKPFAGLQNTFAVTRKSVIVLHEPNESTKKSLRNLKVFQLRLANSLTAYDILNTHKVIITETAMDQVEQRIGSEHASSN